MGGIQVVWLAAIILALAAGAMFPFARSPKIVEVMPGRGPAVQPRGWS